MKQPEMEESNGSAREGRDTERVLTSVTRYKMEDLEEEEDSVRIGKSEEPAADLHTRLRNAMQGMSRTAAEDFLKDLDELLDGELSMAMEIRTLRQQLHELRKGGKSEALLGQGLSSAMEKVEVVQRDLTASRCENDALRLQLTAKQSEVVDLERKLEESKAELKRTETFLIRVEKQAVLSSPSHMSSPGKSKMGTTASESAMRMSHDSKSMRMSHDSQLMRASHDSKFARTKGKAGSAEGSLLSMIADTQPSENNFIQGASNHVGSLRNSDDLMLRGTPSESDTELPSELEIGDMSVALHSERRKCNILTAALEHAQGRLDDLEAQLQRSKNIGASRTGRVIPAQMKEELAESRAKCERAEEQLVVMTRRLQAYMASHGDFGGVQETVTPEATVHALLEAFVLQWSALPAAFSDSGYCAVFRTLLVWCKEPWASDILSKNIAGSISVLARTEAHKQAMLSEGAAHALAAILSECGCDEAKENAVACLSNLALRNPPGRAIIMSSGGLESLLLLLTKGSSPPLQEKACAALANLACGEQVKTVMANQGVIQPLVHICRSNPGDRVVEQACKALRNLAYASDSNCSKIASAGGLQALAHLCEHATHAGVVTQAQAAVSNLACNEWVKVNLREDWAWSQRVMALLNKPPLPKDKPPSRYPPDQYAAAAEQQHDTSSLSTRKRRLGTASRASPDQSRQSLSPSPRPPTSSSASGAIAVRASASDLDRRSEAQHYHDINTDGMPVPSAPDAPARASVTGPIRTGIATPRGDVSVSSSTTFGEVRSSYSELSFARRSPQKHWP